MYKGKERKKKIKGRNLKRYKNDFLFFRPNFVNCVCRTDPYGFCLLIYLNTTRVSLFTHLIEFKFF